MPTLELNGKPFAEQTGTGEPVLKGNLNFEGPIRINNQEVLSANGSIRLTVDEISEKTQGGGITLSHSLKNSSGAEIINSSGSIGSAVDFTNIANNAISGDKIHGGIISNFSSTGIDDNSTNTALTIDSSGNILIGRDSLPANSNDGDGIFCTQTALLEVSRSDGVSYVANRRVSDGASFLFRKDGTDVGSISVTSSGTTYNTTSDLRLKDNIQPISDGTEKLMAMNPVSHTWKADLEAHSVHGFIAQEMVNIIPEAVSGTPDGEEMMTMDYGRITPVLVAALQDAHKKIALLETRLNTLQEK